MTLRYDLPDVAAPLQSRFGARVAMTTVMSVACMAFVLRMLDLDTTGRTLSDSCAWANDRTSAVSMPHSTLQP